ncbi:MAG: hypothetical protein ACI4JQ_05060 [Ruminococcus sp.]
MKKRWIGILTAAAMTAAMAMPVSAAEEVYRVNCSSFSTDGSDVWASLDTNGVLTISGTGGMDSFGFFDETPDYPWANTEDANLIKKIVVEEGVTHFDMVWSTPEAKSVYLPNSLDTMDLFEFIGMGEEAKKIFCEPQTFIGDPGEIEKELTPEKIEVFKEKTSTFICTYYVYKGTDAEKAVSLLGIKSKSMGDVNDDSSIDLDDASSILDFYAKSCAGIDVSADNSIDTDTADLDKDSTIGLNDASCALKYYAGNSAGIETDWTEILKK